MWAECACMRLQMHVFARMHVHMCEGAEVVNTDNLQAGSAMTYIDITPHSGGCNLKNFPDRNDDASTNYTAQPVSYILTKRGTPQ